MSGANGVDRIAGGQEADDLTDALGRGTFLFTKVDGREQIMVFDDSDMIEFRGFGTMDLATYLFNYARATATTTVFDLPGPDAFTSAGFTDLTGLRDNFLIG